MEPAHAPNTTSYEALLRVLADRPLENEDQYRSVYIIQLIQRLHVLISEDRRRLSH